MPFTSNGTFERLHNWEEDRLNGIEIVTDHHDAEDDNFAEGLSQTLLKDGRSAMQGNLNLAGFKIINCAKGQNASDVVTKAQLDALDLNFVPLTHDCEIDGVKKFNTPPLVPEADIKDSSLTAASTSFVKKTIESAFSTNEASLLNKAFPTYETVKGISTGFITSAPGFVIFELPVRMSGWIKVGAWQKSLSYSYSNTQPCVVVFPVANGVEIGFSGCTASFVGI